MKHLSILNYREIHTWDAREKFGPGERFLLLGTAATAFAPPPEFDPFLLRLLFAGR